MSVDLYLSVPQVSCFDAEDDAAAQAAADKAASDKAASDAAAAAGKVFTQDDVNRLLAEDKRKHQAALLKTEQGFKDLLNSNQSLSAQERKTLEENLQTVQGQLRTKEEQAKMEMKELEGRMSAKLSEEQKKAGEWESRYKTETVHRSLSDAAGPDAFNVSQVVSILKPMSKLVEVIDETTGKATGQFKTMVEFPDVDAEGAPTMSVRTPAEAVKRMKELTHIYGNLWKNNVVSGIGSNSATGIQPGADGKVNANSLKNLTPSQYQELRKSNPAALGLKPRGRR